MRQEDESYREQMLYSDLHPEGKDRPLLVQFCGNDPAALAKACQAAAAHGGMDGFDLNLGCPQQVAADGRFGAFLLDVEHWPLVEALVRAMSTATDLPVACKIRLLPELEHTLSFAKMLERAGCRLLAVHGRLRGDPAQRLRRKGPADLGAIAAVKAAATIPVLSNGNVREQSDLLRNLGTTAADGLMVGEALLADPTLFAPPRAAASQTARVEGFAAEYLELAAAHPPTQGFRVVQQHVHHFLGRHGRGTTLRYRRAPHREPKQLRDEIAASSSTEELLGIVRRALRTET